MPIGFLQPIHWDHVPHSLWYVMNHKYAVLFKLTNKVWQTERHLRPKASFTGVVFSSRIGLCYLVGFQVLGHQLIHLTQLSGIGHVMPIVILGRIISGMGGAGIMAMSSIIITGTSPVTNISTQRLILVKTLYLREMSLPGELT